MENFMKTESYKGLVIEARSLQLQNDLGWASVFEIRKHNERDGTVITPFTLRAAFDSEAEAVDVALAHARKKIDEGFLG
jgi:hypothetical protein